MSEYVTNGSWVRTFARGDTIDEIADQFERRVEPSLPMQRAAPAREADPRWPRSARGWRSLGRLHPRTDSERFAGG